ncbi:hypothetical protein COHA_007123 [Chlorella ohadii]|uniref:SBP-type domain-containing protein n=1 Tax=Chlorella ohadii TaxID=2649997 RepID=A0AAD5H073_9CHLO|nr:hypothetical protein COHA_007123 [Chlorella ohadii]
MTAAEVQFGGKAQRFCQQCSRLHPVDRFDGTLRSCREQLARHAERRRLLRKARKQQQAQAQQGEAAAAPPQWQPWQSDNDPAAKRQRLDPLPPFPACPPATFAALPPLPMFADLAGQIPSADSVLLSSATAFSANSLLPPFHSGPLPSVASVLMPPLPLPGSAQPPNSQPAASIETLAAAAELELKQAGQPAAEEPPGLQLPPAQFHLPQQQQQQAPQPNMFGPLQLLLQQQSLQQQVVQTLLQQAAGMAPPAAPPAPVAPQPHPFLDQLMRTMQPAQPQALPATSQALASLLQSLPVPATSNPSQQPPSTQAP